MLRNFLIRIWAIALTFVIPLKTGKAIAEFEPAPFKGTARVSPVDTIFGVAIYSCGESFALGCSDDPVPQPTTTYDLPVWYANIWDDAIQNSIPNYYKDNSFDKHIVYADPKGQNNTQSFVSTTGVTAVGNIGTILHTIDQGATWTSQTSGITNNLYAVYFNDVYIGVTVGASGTILRTTNGGTNWISQTSPTTNDLYGVTFRDANTGTAVGTSGTILRTTDGGQNWTIQSSPTTNDLYGVATTEFSTMVAVGASGTILVSIDGVTWDP